MPKVQKNLVNKVQVLANSVKADLRKKGIVVPIKHKDGSISFDEYSVIRADGEYSIVGPKGRVVVEHINLAQTAIVAANKLALGNKVIDDIVKQDQWYGWKSFDEEIFIKSANTSVKNKDYDKADWCFTRASIAKTQKEEYKRSILSQYSRLKS